jgi:hypothetical protein
MRLARICRNSKEFCPRDLALDLMPKSFNQRSFTVVELVWPRSARYCGISSGTNVRENQATSSSLNQFPFTSHRTNLCEKWLRLWCRFQNGFNERVSITPYRKYRRVAEIEMPTKICRNLESTCKRMLSSQNHIEISKIFHESRYFWVRFRRDFLGATGFRSPRYISFDMQSIPTFCCGFNMQYRLQLSPWLKSLEHRGAIVKNTLRLWFGLWGLSPI